MGSKFWLRNENLTQDHWDYSTPLHPVLNIPMLIVYVNYKILRPENLRKNKTYRPELRVVGGEYFESEKRRSFAGLLFSRPYIFPVLHVVPLYVDSRQSVLLSKLTRRDRLKEIGTRHDGCSPIPLSDRRYLPFAIVFTDKHSSFSKRKDWLPAVYLTRDRQAHWVSERGVSNEEKYLLPKIPEIFEQFGESPDVFKMLEIFLKLGTSLMGRNHIWTETVKWRKIVTVVGRYIL